jgi:tRNA pseudouridine55 synthase
LPHGWIILDKPLGLGSTQAVAAVKRNLRAAGFGKVKVGHGGTLDPLATGVLPIALGEATKLAGRMLDASKVYEFAVAFGAETDTLDLEGKVVRHAPLPCARHLWAAISAHIGPIEQRPPAYSAIKVDGQRAYDLARAGSEVDLPSRRVVIHDLVSTNRLGNRSGDQLVGEAELRAHVSKGTYIRSLARDLALHAGSAGHVTKLRRIRAGPFTTIHAISLDKLGELSKGAPLENILLPLEAGLDGIPALHLGPEQASMVRQGRVLTGLPQSDGLYCVKSGTVPVALVELLGGNATVVRGFNLPDTAE